jgi:hypothetical protein
MVCLRQSYAQLSEPTLSNPPPTRDDVRIALETVLIFVVQQGLINDAEYETVVNLTERMRG